MIIGLTGLKNSGKDTVGAYLVKQHGFERRACADMLKKSLAALLDIPPWEVDKFKNEENTYVSIGYKNEPDEHIIVAKSDKTGDYVGRPNHMWSPIREHSFRAILQRYGTEAHRNIPGWENIWIDQILPLGGYYAGRSIVITDVRFSNEANRINYLGGYIVRISRPAPSEQDPHRSEVEQLNIGVDYTIVNDGTVDDLFVGIEVMLEELGMRTARVRFAHRERDNE